MIEIIPVINANDFEEFEKKVKSAEAFFDLVQIDIMDGKFVATKNFGNAELTKQIQTKVYWELHLMVQDVGDWIKAWLTVPKVKRIIFHIEGVEKQKIKNKRQKTQIKNKKIVELLDLIKKDGIQTGLALNPETPISEVLPFLDELDLVLLLTVPPGRSGQKFMLEVIHKIKKLRKLWPDGKIEVDGGINPATAKKAVDAGANVLASGSYLFSTNQMAELIEELKKSIK